MPTCPTKIPNPPNPKLYSTAPPIFVGFHDYGCQSLDGVDLLVKGTILSKVKSAQGGYILSDPYIQSL